jgi:hypothetical protein
MPPLAERQAEFAAALLDPALAAPSGLVGPDGEDSPRRFAVYRNNVSVALTEALVANFPATRRIVGEEFFRAMALAHARSSPPTTPVLLGYGAAFADFIAGFEPAAELPYLADVARWAWISAHHAPDVAPLPPERLADAPGDQAGRLCFDLHPSVRIVCSRFPVLTIWRMNLEDGTPAPIELEAGGEDALVLRPDADVEVRALPAGAAAFISALAAGRNLAAAADAGRRAAAAFDLAGNLTALLDVGAFANFSRPPGRGRRTGTRAP